MKRVFGCAAWLTIAACSFDWTVGPEPSASDSGAGDAAGGDAAGSNDGASGGDAAPPDGSATCQALEAQEGTARARILRCTASCAGSVLDECNCEVPVEDAQSQTARDYASAAAAYRAAGCASCQPCDPPRHVCAFNVCT